MKTNKHVISEKDSDAKVYKRDKPEHNEPLLSFWWAGECKEMLAKQQWIWIIICVLSPADTLVCVCKYEWIHECINKCMHAFFFFCSLNQSRNGLFSIHNVFNNFERPLVWKTVLVSVNCAVYRLHACVFSGRKGHQIRGVRPSQRPISEFH